MAALYELALWVTVPVVAVVFARPLFSTAVFASRVLIALQAVLIAYTATQARPDAKWEGCWSGDFRAVVDGERLPFR